MSRPFGPDPKPAPRAKRKRARLSSRSAKQRAAYDGEGGREGRRALVARLLEAWVECEAGHRIGRRLAGLEQANDRCRLTDPIFARCRRKAEDVHELLPRSAGGSITEGPNLLRVCRVCHRWIHEHPKDSREIGLLWSRYPPVSA